MKGVALTYASDSLKADNEVADAAVPQSGDALKFVIGRADKSLVLKAVRESGSALQYADDALKADFEVAMAAVSQNEHAIRFAAPALQRDRRLNLAAQCRCCACLRCGS